MLVSIGLGRDEDVEVVCGGCFSELVLPHHALDRTIVSVRVLSCGLTVVVVLDFPVDFEIDQLPNRHAFIDSNGLHARDL